MLSEPTRNKLQTCQLRACEASRHRQRLPKLPPLSRQETSSRGTGRGQLWKPVPERAASCQFRKKNQAVVRAALEARRPLAGWCLSGACRKVGFSDARSWQVWSLFLVGSESKVRHWQGAALDAGRPFAGLCLSGKSGARFLSVQKGTLSTGRGELWKPGVWVVSGEGDVSEARNWQVWS